MLSLNEYLLNSDCSINVNLNYSYPVTGVFRNYSSIDIGERIRLYIDDFHMDLVCADKVVEASTQYLYFMFI